MKKIERKEISGVVEDLKVLYGKIQPRIARFGQLSEEEVEEIVQAHRMHRAIH